MRFSNTSEIPTEIARACVRFAMYQLDVMGYVRRVRVTRCSSSFRGRCIGGSDILIRIGPATMYPRPRSAYREGAPEYDLADQVEALVAVAAHEFRHSRQFMARERRHSEVECEWSAFHVLARFREQRDAVLAPALERQVRAEQLVAARAIRQAAMRSPETRVAEIEARVADWRTRVKRATTYLKKWERKLRRARKARP